jgi:fumarylacetoacetate (FAA) hydrolase family protein
MMPLASGLLPDDWQAACLATRIWDEELAAPRICAIRPDGIFDLSSIARTMSDLLDLADPAEVVRDFGKERFCSVDELFGNAEGKGSLAFRLLAPCDLQAIKAAGVTFIDSMVERVIEERTTGDPALARAVRADLGERLDIELSAVRPGSSEAEAIKQRLLAHGLWSQYLEVGLGPDAEIFTKAQPMSAVGSGAKVGIHPKSNWNNPEPELVLACNSRGEVRGATLGNDVNLRDFEGRSALLLAKAKDNNASCAIGPFIRLFDRGFEMDDLRRMEIALRVEGVDGFTLDAVGSMSRISRDPLELVSQAFGPEHQYPDGFMLFLGTPFAPTDDRDEPGLGFTHKIGDIVRISSRQLGTLANEVTTSGLAEPWTYGVRALVASLQRC